jgi:peptidyl-prolyl cis-trans isomerase D
MFDWVHNNKRIIQVVLALIFLPFLFFGVDSYFRGSELGAEVARVGDYKITQQEFSQAVRERQDAMRRMLSNAPIDPAVLESAELRFAALEQIVRERLLLSNSLRAGLTVTDEQLRDVITNHENFREGGKFSHALYESFLRSQNMSATGFEARLRRDLLQQPIMDAFGESGFIPRTVAQRLVQLTEQTREISIATIAPATFAAQVSIEDAALKAYYDSHAREFEIPEQVRLEYVVLSLDNLAAQTDVPAEEVRQAFEQNSARFATPEEREASHILIQATSKASAEARAAAKARAEELTKQLRDKPERFADLAREHSQDPGSAQNGGELGFLVRGAANKAFEDALFAMKAGEIAGPVETEFGHHIIRLKSVRGGSAKSFDEVRSAIESELKRTRAARRFAELAEQLNNTVYEQSDSLKPVAEALKLPIQQSPWITRKPVPGSPLGSEKFLKAAFSEDVIKNKRNSEVVEVAPSTLIATRLLEHKPATGQPFEEVQGEIRKRLTAEEARKRAAADGREKLEKLRKGEDLGLNWSKPLAVSRANPGGLAEPVLRAVFRMDAAKVPAFTGVEDGAAGYQLVRLSRVTTPTEVTADVRKAAAEQLRRMIGQEQLTDYVAALKQRVDVKIKQDVIEKK